MDHTNDNKAYTLSSLSHWGITYTNMHIISIEFVCEFILYTTSICIEAKPKKITKRITQKKQKKNTHNVNYTLLHFQSSFCFCPCSSSQLCFCWDFSFPLTPSLASNAILGLWSNLIQCFSVFFLFINHGFFSPFYT